MLTEESLPQPIWQEDAQATQPRHASRIRRPAAARLAHTPIWLVLLSALLGIIVLTCVVCSFTLALLGPDRVLALRDRVLGTTAEARATSLGEIIDVVIRGEDAWPLPGKGRLTILLMGVDRRSDQGDVPTRTDAITLITIDPQSNTAAMLSIPRDLYVPLAGLDRVDRINTAYFYGEARRVPGGGVQAAQDTIAWNLGIPINRHIIVDFEGFKRAIDALGGIDVDVPKRIVDNAYPTEDYGIEQLVIEAGPTHMDGELALKYVRTRHPDSDFGRLQRQQQVLLAVGDKALSLGVVAQLPTLLDAVAGSYQTDLTIAEIVSIARAWSDTLRAREKLTTYRIDETMAQHWSTPTGASVLIPNREAIAPLVDAFLGRAQPAPAAAP